MRMSKAEVVRQYLYPLGNEKRVVENGLLALRSGYTVTITPPERREPNMYVVREKQLFPETEWRECQGPLGEMVVFHTHHEAARYAGEQMGLPRNLGKAFRVDQQPTADPDAIAAAERREYLI